MYKVPTLRATHWRSPGPQTYVKQIAFMAGIRGLGPLFYILLGFRQSSRCNLRGLGCRVQSFELPVSEARRALLRTLETYGDCARIRKRTAQTP